MTRLAAGITALFVAVVLLVPQRASAEPFVDLGVGMLLPIAEDDWADLVDSSPILSLRLGALTSPTIGFMGSLDWTPYREDFNNASISRTRLMGHAVFASHAGTTMLAGRIGLGLDIHRFSIEFLGTEAHESDTGLALEGGFGAWFPISRKVLIGVEGAIPIGLHDDDEDLYDENVTTVEVILSVGLRFLL
jgi:hypothetical protein